MVSKLLQIALALSILTGCASSGSGGAKKYTGEDSLKSIISLSHQEIIAVDFVSLFIQLPDTSPFYTTVQFSELHNVFGRELVRSMKTSGYGIQMVDSDQGLNFINYRINAITGNSSNGNIRVRVALNSISIEREYAIRASKIFPSTEFRVKGTEPTKTIINNDLFNTHSGKHELPSAVQFIKTDGTKGEYYESHKNRAVDLTSSGDAYNSQLALMKSKAAIFTLDRIGHSKAKNIDHSKLTNHRVLKIRFKNNTLILGQRNKQALELLVNGLDKVDDVVLITGCSHGNSLIWDGTESESLNRQQRVKEELLSHGIRGINILEQGCFQSDYEDELLPGMVIVTHKKSITNFL